MVVLYVSDTAAEDWRGRAEQFGLRPVFEPPAEGVYLKADSDGIGLCSASEKGVVRVDFAGGAAQHRLHHGGGEMIAKAVNHAAKPVVWDATGGLGRDSFVLASLGLTVEAFERHPAAACLFSDGLKRAQMCAAASAVVSRIGLHFGDAVLLMPDLAEKNGKPDVVYLDPMYPERRKAASVKKEMAYFHRLCGLPQDEEALLSCARALARKRVVVKRPRLGAFLCGCKPAYQYTGKSTRFDVYLPESG